MTKNLVFITEHLSEICDNARLLFILGYQ